MRADDVECFTFRFAACCAMSLAAQKPKTRATCAKTLRDKCAHHITLLVGSVWRLCAAQLLDNTE
eukprot:3379479-Amphidinium_carterae.1